MKNMHGWLKLYRGIFDNETVTRSPEHIAVWLYLLCHATPKEYTAVFKGEEITLKPGQLITGRNEIAKCVNSRISPSSVQRILKTFENAHQIEQQTTNKNRLITLVNWDRYQNSEQQTEQQANIKRTSSEHQADTYREDIRRKEEYNQRIYGEKLRKKQIWFKASSFDPAILDEQTLFDD